MRDEGVATARDESVAVVTGAASGIGAATAVELASSGTRIIACDLPSANLSAVSQAVEAAGGTPCPCIVDVRDYAALQNLARLVIDDHGRVDVLFANAGVDEQSSLVTGDPAAWRDVLETNLLGTVQTVRAFLPAMVERDGGDIVITGSASGRETPVGNPVYGSSKWGLVGFSRALRNELEERRSHVRVTLIDPGLVDTPLARSIPALQKRLDEGCSLVPGDIARLVSFVIHQPRHVLLSELRIEPIVRNVPASLARKASNRLVDMLDH